MSSTQRQSMPCVLLALLGQPVSDRMPAIPASRSPSRCTASSQLPMAISRVIQSKVGTFQGREVGDRASRAEYSDSAARRQPRHFARNRATGRGRYCSSRMFALRMTFVYFAASARMSAEKASGVETKGSMP